jgi:hypothetical protein
LQGRGGPHVPPEQFPEGHTTPQLPQLPGSLSLSTQLVPQVSAHVQLFELHTAIEEHVPQSRVWPQPSLMEPHVAPISTQVLGVHEVQA